jgi:zinc/manganese transport system substrate-binding protein
MLKKMFYSSSILFFATLSAHAEPIKVVATFSILGDIAANIGGDKIELKTLVGSDSDAHVYEPTPLDAAAVSSAKIILINGLGFEGFIKKLVETNAKYAQLMTVSEGVAPLKSAEDEGHNHKSDSHDSHAVSYDPHAFQSVPNIRIYVKNITKALCKQDSKNCPFFESNSAVYDAKLAALDNEIRAIVAKIPGNKRVIITSHDSFGYFAHEYGFKFIAPEGISTEFEASASDIAQLIDQVRADKASALFVENISDPRLIEQISKDTGIKVGGSLYSDALSGDNSSASTYIDLMRYNTNTIYNVIVGK